MSETTPVTRLVLVRHGESQVTVQRVIGGPLTCSGLSELGRDQAERLRDRLANGGEVRVDHLYSSAYPRALETAEIIAPALDRTMQVEEGFGEHDPGPECDGLSFGDFVDRHGAPDWSSNPYAITFPGGETVGEFHLRVGSTLTAVLARHPGDTVLIVCHGGVIDAYLRMALRTASTGVFEIQTTNTSLTELALVQPGRWRLVRYNDAGHLVGLPRETART